MFGPPSSLDKNAGRICGHIMPLSYAHFVYGLRRAGFTEIEFHTDRLKRSSLFLSIVSYPLLWIGAWSVGAGMLVLFQIAKMVLPRQP